MKTIEEATAAIRERIQIARHNEAYAAHEDRQDRLSAHDARVTAESLEYALELIQGRKAKAPKRAEKKDAESSIKAA